MRNWNKNQLLSLKLNLKKTKSTLEMKPTQKLTKNNRWLCHSHLDFLEAVGLNRDDASKVDRKKLMVVALVLSIIGYVIAS